MVPQGERHRWLRFRRAADCKCTRDREEPADAPSAMSRRRGRRSDWRCSRRFRGGTFTLRTCVHA